MEDPGFDLEKTKIMKRGMMIGMFLNMGRLLGRYCGLLSIISLYQLVKVFSNDFKPEYRIVFFEAAILKVLI